MKEELSRTGVFQTSRGFYILFPDFSLASNAELTSKWKRDRRMSFTTIKSWTKGSFSLPFQFATGESGVFLND